MRGCPGTHISSIGLAAGVSSTGGASSLEAGASGIISSSSTVETKRDHAINSLGEACWLVEYETGGKNSSLEEQVGEVVDGLVGLVFCHFLLEFLNDSVIRIQLESSC